MPATVQLFHWVYAAKFLCGELKPTEPEREGPAETGRYATAINVHNPGPRPDRLPQEGGAALRRLASRRRARAADPAEATRRAQARSRLRPRDRLP